MKTATWKVAGEGVPLAQHITLSSAHVARPCILCLWSGRSSGQGRTKKVVDSGGFGVGSLLVIHNLGRYRSERLLKEWVHFDCHNSWRLMGGARMPKVLHRAEWS